MTPRLSTLAQAATQALQQGLKQGFQQGRSLLRGRPLALLTATAACASAWLLWQHPPLVAVPRGDMALRVNALTGQASAHGEGTLWAWPLVHELRRYSLRDQLWHNPADGGAMLQSVEGLSFGMDLSVRWALDGAQVPALSRRLPDDLAAAVVQPAVQAVVYKTLARYTVRETFSTKRADIQQALEAELKPRLAADGVVLKGVLLGKVALPADYRRGMDALLAEELASAKMRFTLELKEKQVQQTALEAEADRVRREKSSQASAQEQLIAARAQEEAMRHVLPFKQKQIEQRQLEAEAEKQAQIRRAEGSAQARRVEAAGEADSRQKLADAEAYRLDRVGRVASEQMAREGALISRHPLLIQKTLADKLSDKINVIIAPPSTGGFIGAGLVGDLARASRPPAADAVAERAEPQDAQAH